MLIVELFNKLMVLAAFSKNTSPELVALPSVTVPSKVTFPEIRRVLTPLLSIEPPVMFKTPVPFEFETDRTIRPAWRLSGPVKELEKFPIITPPPEVLLIVMPTCPVPSEMIPAKFNNPLADPPIWMVFKPAVEELIVEDIVC